MTEELKNELDSLYGLSLAKQTARVVDKLTGMGITPIENSTTSTINKSYVVGDYALVDIQPVYFPERRTPCIIDKCIYDEVGRCHFRNEVRDRRIWDGYHLEPKITISGNGLERDNYKIYRYILKAPEKVPVDHIMKSVVLNTRECIKLTTPKENQMNRKCTKGLSEEEKLLRMQHDFSKTWYVYVYWRMLGLISEEEAFAYNLEKNK